MPDSALPAIRAQPFYLVVFLIVVIQLRPRGGGVVTYRIRQRGNALSIVGPVEFSVLVEGIDLVPEISHTFAIFGLLPLAMSAGVDLHIDGPIDAVALDNAERLSDIWQMWSPRHFKSIRVTGSVRQDRQGARPHPVVALFSGGVDSTFSLMRRVERGEPNGHVLTAAKLIDPVFERIRPTGDALLRSLGQDRIVVRSDLSRRMHYSSLTHGFYLLSLLHLVSDSFQSGLIAADYTPEQYMAVSPWGTNFVSNNLFASADFVVRTDCLDVSRTEKLAVLARNSSAFGSLTFCHHEKFRPHNCGRCSKCVRTKAMLLATGDPMPDIFIDPTLTPEMLGNVKMHDRKEWAFFAELYAFATRRGTLDKLPGLEPIVAKARRRESGGVARRVVKALQSRQFTGESITKAVLRQI